MLIILKAHQIEKKWCARVLCDKVLFYCEIGAVSNPMLMKYTECDILLASSLVNPTFLASTYATYLAKSQSVSTLICLLFISFTVFYFAKLVVLLSYHTSN
jgi:hypothetical protein